MSADLSRVRLNPLLDYAGVDLKQGGVLLDADANELMAIVDRRLRALASDTLGRATVSSTTPDAFKITAAAGTLLIGKGRLYVDGLLAENHGAVSTDPAKRAFDDLLAEPAFTGAIDYKTAQPYLPAPPALPTGGRHLVYLDVWDREVTHLEEPNLVESAVGVETSSRAQTVWQVRVVPDVAGAGASCASPDGDLAGWTPIIAPSTGVLSTGTFDVAAVDDPCELPPTGGYRGLENQLYRVEIHDGGLPGGGATFKWSRENASVGSHVATVVSASELELETLGRDDVLRFNTGDWVEITDDLREFSQTPGVVRRITVNDATRRIQFAPPLPGPPGPYPDSTFPRLRHMRVRRWDHKGLVFRTDVSGTPVQVQDLDAVASTGVIAVPAEGTTLLLENGVTVAFASTGAQGFRAGDYWVFAARTADASVERLDRAPPRGIHHHYARLALWDVDTGNLSDCRNPWPPSGDGHDCGCTACVSAASHASGAFTIQNAVDKVQATGGTVCLGPGQYALAEPVRLTGARSVRLRGQGAATVVSSPGSAFLLQNCLAVAIENLTILSRGQTSAITVRTALGLAVREAIIAVLGTGDTLGAAISLQGIVGAASIAENVVFAPLGILANDPHAALPAGADAAASVLLAAALAIEDNLLWCQRQAVSLTGTVLHVLETRVAGNEILACSETAISALGLSAPGASMTIRGNSLGVTGTGIRCGVDGAWVEGNKLLNSAPAAVRDGTTVGVALATGLDKNGPGECQILANQISGFASAGILIDSPARELIVKLNIIEDCGNGILSGDNANAGSVSIENNHLRNIGPTGRAAAGMVVGIGVARAEAAIIAGNTIRTLGVQALLSEQGFRAAILAFGALQARIRSNEVAEIAPGESGNLAAGIMLHAPYTQFEVTHNHVQRDAGQPPQVGTSPWLALLAMDTDLKSPVSRLGNLTTVRLDASSTLVLAGTRAYVSAFPAGVTGAAPEGAHGLVLGNVLSARGTRPAVELTVAGECLFNDNRIELQGGAAAVALNTDVAIINGNRVVGGKLAIQVNAATLLPPGTPRVAVVGNITKGSIQVPGALTAPWDSLNVSA